MLLIQRWNDFKFGTVNDIEASELPKEAVLRSQNMYYKENRWRKVPGLADINSSQLAAGAAWSIGKWFSIVPKKSKILASCLTDLYAQNDDNTFSSIDSTIISGALLEYLSVPPFTYYGSQLTTWKRFDGGTKSYAVGNDNPPKKFIKIIFNPYAGRYFGIGDPDNPDLLYWSNHLTNGGIEQWPDGNTQIFDTVHGDSPKSIETYEGRVQLFSENSVNSGSVIGVPQNWSFQKERAQTGAVSGRTVKRYGNFFLMLAPNFEVYKWPHDVFITKGRVKFKINPYTAHLATAEIREDRYYEITFKSSEATSSDNYHSWTYDILGDRWYGPHTKRNIVSMFYDRENRRLLQGGADDLEGFIFDMRGPDIRNAAMPCRLTTGFDFQGDMSIDKRYEAFRVKTNQAGSKPGGEGQLQVIINVDQREENQQSQTLTLEDPKNEDPIMDTSKVRDSIIKRGNIYESVSRGSSIQFDFRYEVAKENLEISSWELDYRTRTPKKNRGV